MGSTTNFNLPYPEPSNTPDGPAQIQALAEAVDGYLIPLSAPAEFGSSVEVVGNLGVQGATTVEDVTATSVTTADFEATGDVTVQGQVWTGAWLDFNPNWNCEAGSSPDVGNGTLTARYIQVGKTVHFQITLVAGTTTTFGNSTSGFWRFNLPVAPRMESVAYVLCRDFNSGNRFTGACELSTAITNGVLRVNAPVDGSNGSVHYQNPFVWTTSDTMRISGTYEVN
jgi:hypothetical protein